MDGFTMLAYQDGRWSRSYVHDTSRSSRNHNSIFVCPAITTSRMNRPPTLLTLRCLSSLFFIVIAATSSDDDERTLFLEGRIVFERGGGYG